MIRAMQTIGSSNVKMIAMVTATIAATVSCTHAFEIQLKQTAACQSAVIRVRDVAVISGVDEQLLAPIERVVLAPAPASSRIRCVTASQIRNALSRYNIDLRGCRFTGPPIVQVRSTPRDITTVKPVSDKTQLRFDLNAVKQQVAKAVFDEMQTQNPDEKFDVDVELARRKLWELPEHWDRIRVVGLNGRLDKQKEITAEFVSGKESVAIPISLRIQRHQLAVVAKRQLERGDLIGPSDVELCSIEVGGKAALAFEQLEDVIGKEVAQRVPTGELVATIAVRSPILVRRRDQVSVLARAGSIVVRRRAQSRDEGSLGDIIQLETTDGQRKKFRARVTGVRQAEVIVGT